LESLSYVDAVLWLAVRLADALTHAHERGIVHRDVKPANILLTDDGQPMLLDFNLAEDGKSHRHYAEVQVGGTARYIAPEQRTARERGTWPADERTDLYSFGLVLHELLTGQHPFQLSPGPVHESGRGGDEEWRRPVDVRRKNPAVSHGLEAIVRHCLEPDPARRYRTARELRADLQCQLDHLPLQHTPEPSLRERARKWMRRHPRLVSSAGVGAIAALLILGLVGASLLRIGRPAPQGSEQLAEGTRLKAVAAQRQLHDDLKKIEFLLGSDVPNAEREQREEGLALARQAVARHGVLESPHWQDTPLVTALTPEERQAVRDDMGELLLLLAGASAEPGRVDPALRLNDLAAGCYPAETIPRAIWQQRAELVRSAGRIDEAKQLLAKAEGVPAHAPRDRYLLLLTESQGRGRLSEILPLLTEASRHQKDSFSVWLILGNCYIAAGKRTEAVECYDMAGTLWPESHWPSLCRGLAFLEQGNDRRAIAAFDEVIRLRPETSLAYYNRALAKSHVGDLAGAEADVTALLDRPNPPLRGYFLRASIRSKRRDREGARRDQQDGLRAEARDERDLTARGLVKQPRDPKGALADYNSALELDPRYLAALQNKANVLGEILGRTEEALATLDTLIAFHPDEVPAIAGRGVLNGRLGRREAAHADAREALRRDTKPYNIYQVAGIYALTSRRNPHDRQEALRLLESALSQGVGLDLIDRDRDLDAIRDTPEFQRLVGEMRARRAKTVERATTQAGRPR
jgi:tetratricopeptide (TPR) repeat protein